MNIRRLTGMHLQLAGYDVRELEDAAAAREALKKEQPALVLLDIMMPGEDGFSLGEDLIRSGLPVIFLTAKTSVPDRVRGLRLGAEDYILKPLSRRSCWPGWRTRSGGTALPAPATSRVTSGWTSRPGRSGATANRFP